METPELAPGFENAHEVLDEGEVPQDDLLLNALCQFDFLWCTVAVATHTESGDGPLFYPSCAALSQERTTPVIDLIARSKPVRGAVLPYEDDKT